LLSNAHDWPLSKSVPWIPKDSTYQDFRGQPTVYCEIPADIIIIVRYPGIFLIGPETPVGWTRGSRIFHKELEDIPQEAPGYSHMDNQPEEKYLHRT
jgi:hypothetical protein